MIEEKKSNEEIQKEMLNELKNFFRPEFLNRIDDIIVYNPINNDTILKITDLLLNEVSSILEKKNIKVSFDKSLKDYLISI